ncbi:LrgB family protein [Anaerosinus massiliensis]|uniref:LrgB family protein n=1 Tax=Massilibacillus massiliensis TaxID=1806837 RepID=UPI000A6D1D37|nr:LrgB family protein [Massilibacillus massiliensis]
MIKMIEIFDNPITMIALCITAYQIGLYIHRKTKIQVLNPLFIAIVLIIAVLQTFHISLETFNKGGSIINMLLCPATIMLAIPMYNQRKTIKKNIVPIAIGTVVGSIVSMSSIYILCKLAGISDQIAMSMLPKSTTTPIAIEISNTLGGIPALTVAAVIMTGILGSILIPSLIKIFRINNSVAAGIAIGTASHALGSAKAVELGETEAALAGIAVGVAGMVSVVLVMFI